MLSEYWSPIILEHKKDYQDLVRYCDSTSRPLETDKIHQINSHVPVPLLT